MLVSIALSDHLQHQLIITTKGCQNTSSLFHVKQLT